MVFFLWKRTERSFWSCNLLLKLPCILFSLCCYDETLAKSNLEERICFILILHNPPLREVKAGTQDRKLKPELLVIVCSTTPEQGTHSQFRMFCRNHGGCCLLTGSLSGSLIRSCPSCFLYSPELPSQRIQQSTVYWDPLINSLSR